jgi:hypothetical protein
MAYWDWEKEQNFPRLLNRLAKLEAPDDQLVLCRLRELTEWYVDKPHPGSELSGLANTFREINDLLAITRGVRNSVTHFESADQALYGIMLHLAKILFEAFAAAWRRDSVVPGASPAPFAQCSPAGDQAINPTADN